MNYITFEDLLDIINTADGLQDAYNIVTRYEYYVNQSDIPEGTLTYDLYGVIYKAGTESTEINLVNATSGIILSVYKEFILN